MGCRISNIALQLDAQEYLHRVALIPKQSIERKQQLGDSQNLMPDNQIYKIQFPLDVLRRMPAKRSSALLRVGMFINELNWLQRLLLISRVPNNTNEAEHQATLALALMVTKLLSGKIHEGWNKLSKELDIPEESLSESGKSIRRALESRLAKDSLIHKLRNFHAFHYSAQIGLGDLETLSLDQSEIAVYFTGYQGHSLFHLSELAAIGKFADVTGLPPGVDSLDLVISEVVAAASEYADYLYEVVLALAGADLETMEPVVVPNSAIHCDDRPLLFFALPPGVTDTLQSPPEA